MKSKSLNPISSGILDCRTNYICISGGEKCNDFSSEQEVVKINLNKKSGESDEAYNSRIKNDVMKSVADEMADCWWMFGEGKIDYSPYEATTLFQLHCGICSSVKFDKTIQDYFKTKNAKITYEDFYKHTETLPKASSETYLKYIYGVDNIPALSSLLKKELSDKLKISESFELDKRYSVVIGSDPEIDIGRGSNNDKHVHPYIIKADEISAKTKCEIFDITKS